MARNRVAADPDQITAWRHGVRARAAGCEGAFTGGEWRALRAEYLSRCARCLRREGGSVKIVPDHVTPLRLGGRNDISNIQPLCSSCNTVKAVRKDKSGQRSFAGEDYRETFPERVRMHEYLASLENTQSHPLKPGQEYVVIHGAEIPVSWLLRQPGIDVRRESGWDWSGNLIFAHGAGTYLILIKRLPPEEQ